MLKFISYKDDMSVAKLIKPLYISSFPKKERVPFFLLKQKAKKQVADLCAIYDDNTFIGMCYTVFHNDIVYVFYLAICEECHGKGYGTEVLKLLKQKFAQKRIVLNIEEIDDKAPDNDMRIRRKNFYLRAGFKECGFKVIEYGVTFEMMYCGKEVRSSEYKALIDNYLGRFFSHLYLKLG